MQGLTAMGYKDLDIEQVRVDVNQSLAMQFLTFFFLYLGIQNVLMPMLFEDHPSNVITQSHVDEELLVLFISAMLNRVDPSEPHLQALCVVPTRKMADKIIEIGSEIAQFAPIKLLRFDGSVENIFFFFGLVTQILMFWL